MRNAQPRKESCDTSEQGLILQIRYHPSIRFWEFQPDFPEDFSAEKFVMKFTSANLMLGLILRDIPFLQWAFLQWKPSLDHDEATAGSALGTACQRLPSVEC